MKKKKEVESEFAVALQCQMICGDGSGKRPTKHVDNCPWLNWKYENN